MTAPGRLTGYLAAEGYVDQLVEELGAVAAVHGRLVLAPGPPRDVAWALNVWREPRRLAVASINDAARQLRAIQRNWWPYAFHLHRRTALIQEKLPKVSAKPLVFGEPPPRAPLGSFTLLDASTLLASADCSSPFPNGEVRFVEDREGPPNRAYLKLWELFTRLERRPAAGELCLELGASPGGWTWVLANLGARVVAVDKAPLAPEVAALANVRFRRESAFALDPAALGRVDWLFSDVVCYPRRLWTLVRRWLDAGTCRNMVCTIKFQGEKDHAIARQFAEVPGSRLLHLSHNKHELTWAYFSSA